MIKDGQSVGISVSIREGTGYDIAVCIDDMIETFRQSSILIQENPTRTEFYAGN